MSIGRYCSIRSVTVSPDGANMYVAIGDKSRNKKCSQNAVAVLSLDEDESGKLYFVQVLEDAVGASQKKVIVSPDSDYVYVMDPNGDAVVVFSREASDSGKLTFVQALKFTLDGTVYDGKLSSSPSGFFI